MVQIPTSAVLQSTGLWDVLKDLHFVAAYRNSVLDRDNVDLLFQAKELELLEPADSSYIGEGNAVSVNEEMAT